MHPPPSAPEPSTVEHPADLLPVPVDTGRLQMCFVPVLDDEPEDDEDEERTPAFFCWSVPDMQRGEVASRLAAWDAPVPPRMLTPGRMPLMLPARRPRRRTPEAGVCETRGYFLSLDDGIQALVGLGAGDSTGRRRPSASVTTWSLALKLALELVAREQIVPVLRGTPGERRAWARWAAAITHQTDRERFERLAAAMPLAAHALARIVPGQDPSVWRPRELLRIFLDTVVDSIVRRSLLGEVAAPDGDRPRPAGGRPAAGRPAPWEKRFAGALTSSLPLIIPYGLGESRLIEELGRWARPALGAGYADFRACLRLDPPASAAERFWQLSYHLQSAAVPELLVSAGEIWSSPADRLHVDGHEVIAPQECLLRDLAEAAHVFVPISDSLDETHPTSLELTANEAWAFLSEAAPVLEQAGLGVLVPASLGAAGNRRLRARLRVSGSEATASTDGAVRDRVGTVRLGPDALADFRWEAAIGDDTLTPEDFKELTALKQPLVRWRDEWVVLEPGMVTELRKLLARPEQTGMSGAVALAALLSGVVQTPSGRAVDVLPTPDLANVIEKLREHGFPDVQTPPEFVGELRPYQRRGLRWLAGMCELGLGTCLADDMGLGKTIQLLALLLDHRRRHPQESRATLVICPTSVLGNWQREIERFAPVLPVVRHHGPERARTAAALRRQLSRMPAHAVVLTTYALARRDAAALGSIEWSHAVLDEAQNIKNPRAQQARAVRTLRAGHRIALTGTPIENRLAELWSIFEFLNPGLLGSLEQFRRQLAIPVERYRNPDAMARLRRLTGPFLLRRLKSDPSIIRDLPAKLEMTVHCTLTREQAALYQAALDEMMTRIEESRGMSRRGLILKLITELKQICNHPVHFQREPGPLPTRSGKLDRLLEMLDEARSEGDRSLVYSQYKEMGDLLVQAVQAHLDVDVPFLHGGVPPRRRDQLVDRFQEEGDEAPPVFVLSLKAGGTGLNLTAANRVFHFDRWWNPAVEDQATDRAHRIGQTRTVQVHKMVTIGTLEERIDRMLIEKRELAEQVVGAGETWLTEMSDDELRELLALGGDAVVEEAGGGA